MKQRLFLGSVAFGISFGISFVTGRNLGNAIGAGATTTVATIAAALVVDRKYHGQAYNRIADLKNHIQALQQRRAEAYHAYQQLEAEKEQLAVSLDTLAMQSAQPRLMSAPSSRSLPPALKGLSWDLSTAARTQPPIEVKPYELPTEISAADSAASSPWGNPATGRQSDTQINDTLNQELLADATAAKRKIEANLAALQAELSQIKGQITDHRQNREKLSRELANLREEKRQLEAIAKTLKGEVKDLETCRVELEQFLAYAEAKKHELETGTNPLQEALKQLQTQVSSLQVELSVLEAQILDRRSQKEALEQQLEALDAAQLAVTMPPKAPVKPELKGKHGSSNGSNGNSEAYSQKAIVHQDALLKQPLATASVHQPTTGSAQTKATVAVPEPIGLEKTSSDLPSEWTEFMVQLPEYELQVIKVIVEQNRPAAVLKHIAEENLTMPELLIDSINERALETIGDLLIDAGSGAGSATIVRDHLKTVKKLLKTYEYLAN
ncbi:tellurite resistance TerB C-terminal domain-containing protein [Stenomitos frigidus]|uniref:tellurite resistance TerB C-terminal domain-containing protein n=1 Tax=Stenomitos frigidus TaxID=1886765 RepID=UPI0015E68D06|nr:tellurite resistance TerB C-terminal domain-containing protein [Stenomitos frigidus]